MDTHTDKYIISEVVLKTENKLLPIIVSFQNGELSPVKTPNLRCGVYRDKKNGRKRVVAMASSNNFLYKGYESPLDANTCRTLIAIRNKNSNKVRLIEADSVQLSPELLGPEPEEDSDALDTKICYSKLDTAFGSKRNKRQREINHRMQFEVETLSEQLTQVVAAANIVEKDLNLPSDNDIYTYFPCNRNAETVQQVYQLNDIIPVDELNSLQKEAEELDENMEFATEAQYSKFLCYYLHKLKSTNKVEKIKMLLYADLILKFLKLKPKELLRKNLVVCSTQILNARLLGTYSQISTSGRTRPNSIIDMALGHVIILGLMANDFQLELEPIIQSVKLGGVRLIKLSQVIGAVPLSKSKKSSIVLKVPLPPPPKPFTKKRNTSSK